MVRHATVKKRRSGSKVSFKQQKHLSLRVQEKLNKEIRKAYDKNLTVKENLANMGLVADPNEMEKSSAAAKKDSAFLGFITNSQGVESKKKKKLSDLDLNYVRANVKKHGDDFKAMERDIKTNYMQHTAKQMEKLVKQYRQQVEEGDEEK